jgi:dimethylglycine dehydrogenase
MRWFETHLASADIRVRNVSDAVAGVALFGPRSRALLARMAGPAVDAANLPFMGLRELDVGYAPALVGRISVTGELGYEIHVPATYLAPLYEALLAAGEDLGLRDVGIYALNSLRLEKGYGIWSREFSRDYTPASSGLARFIAYDKPRFIGREAALADRMRPPQRRLVTLAVDVIDADASGFEPLWSGDIYVGFTTSGGYGHMAGLSLAMGYLDSGLANPGTELAVTVVGERRACRVLGEPAIDPTGSRLRS